MSSPTTISLTLITQTDCPSCVSGKRVLAELGEEFPLHIDEVDVNSENGRTLALAQLIAHGRLSKRALRRQFTKIITPTDLERS
jgi:predicted DsbA family dithiol-disulfide isomerase